MNVFQLLGYKKIKCANCGKDVYIKEKSDLPWCCSKYCMQELTFKRLKD